jgi:hypothetical protein
LSLTINDARFPIVSTSIPMVAKFVKMDWLLVAGDAKMRMKKFA